MLSHARIGTTRATGPWHLIDERASASSIVETKLLAVRCGLMLPLYELEQAQMGYDRSRDIQCGDCVRAEVLRLVEIANGLREYGYSSRDGYCRHGVYVGGSGIDWMCGTCESYSLDEEVAEIRLAAADTLRTAVYS